MASVQDPGSMDSGEFRPPSDVFRILVVDDDKVSRSVLRAMLEQAGYTGIDEAEDGALALEALKQDEYHLVLLDKNMPGIDGLEVLERGKQLRPACEFIMITAYGSLESAIEAIDLGAFSYLTKPLDKIDSVVTRVGRALEIAAIKHENALLTESMEQLLDDLDRNEVGGSGSDQIEGDQVKQALAKLRWLGGQLDLLQERAEGKGATVLEKVGHTVKTVLEMLEKAIGEPAGGPPVES